MDVTTAVRTVVQAARAERWTVAALADHLGVAAPTVYRWTNGRRRPNATNRANLERLARELLQVEVAAPVLTTRSLRLQDAADALEDPKARAEFEARMRAKHRAIRAHHEAQRAERQADLQAEDKLRWQQRRIGHTPLAEQLDDPFDLLGAA